MITLFFRYDDYSALSPLEVDSCFVDIMRRYHMPCTLAVTPSITTGIDYVPGERDEVLLCGRKLDFLRHAMQDGVVDIAFHGWNHRAHYGAQLPNPSEFSGLSYDEQLTLISRGVDFLQSQAGCAPKIFVPPWNTCDLNTLRVVEQLGMTCVSSNRYFPVSHTASLSYAPMTIEVRQLRAAIQNARSGRDSEPIIGVMLHPYNFCESTDSRSVVKLDDFARDIEWLSQCSDIQVKAIASMVDSGDDLSSARFDKNRPSKLENIFPPFVEKTYDDPLYLTTVTACKTRKKKEGVTIVFHAAVMMLAMVIMKSVLSSIPIVSDEAIKVIGFTVAVPLLLLAIRAAYYKRIFFRGVVVLSVLAGLFIGLFL